LRFITATCFIASLGQSSSGTTVAGNERNDTDEVIQENEMITYLRMIEFQYQVEIENKKEITDRVISRTRDTICMLSIAFSLNSWVAIGGLSGKIEIPIRVIDSIIDHALEKRVI
jgi:hypothetical protein